MVYVNIVSCNFRHEFLQKSYKLSEPTTVHTFDVSLPCLQVFLSFLRLLEKLRFTKGANFLPKVVCGI